MQLRLIFLFACLAASTRALPRRVTGDHDDVVDPAHLKPTNEHDERPMVTQEDAPDAVEPASSASGSDDGEAIVEILRPRQKKSPQYDEYELEDGEYDSQEEYQYYEEEVQEIPNSDEFLEEEEYIYEDNEGFDDSEEFQEQGRKKKSAVKSVKRSSSPVKSAKKSVKRQAVKQVKKINKRSPIKSALKKVVKRSVAAQVPVKRSPSQGRVEKSAPSHNTARRFTSRSRIDGRRSKKSASETEEVTSDVEENDAVVVESCDSLLEACKENPDSVKCNQYEEFCMTPQEDGEFVDTFLCEGPDGTYSTNCITPYERK